MLAGGALTGTTGAAAAILAAQTGSRELQLPGKVTRLLLRLRKGREVAWRKQTRLHNDPTDPLSRASSSTSIWTKQTLLASS